MKDRFGTEIKLGSRVMFCEYNRDAALYIGNIDKITEKTVKISRQNKYGSIWTRIINKYDLESNLIVIPDFWEELPQL